MVLVFVKSTKVKKKVRFDYFHENYLLCCAIMLKERKKVFPIIEWAKGGNSRY